MSSRSQHEGSYTSPKHISIEIEKCTRNLMKGVICKGYTESNCKIKIQEDVSSVVPHMSFPANQKCFGRNVPPLPQLTYLCDNLVDGHAQIMFICCHDACKWVSRLYR